MSRFIGEICSSSILLSFKILVTIKDEDGVVYRGTSIVQKASEHYVFYGCSRLKTLIK